MSWGYVPPARIALAAVVACLLFPAAAGATTFCVVQSGTCPGGQTQEPSLQTALAAAAAAAPGPNTISLGAGTYDAAGSGFDYSTVTAPAVTITGAGQGQTTLQAGAGAGFVLRLGTAGSSVNELSIAVRTPMTAGLILSADATRAHHVTVTGSGALAATDGVQLDDGGTFADGTVTMPENSHAAVDQASGATGVVSNSHLTAAIGLATAAIGHPGLAARDVVISASDNAVSVPATGAVTVDDALMLMHGDSPTAMAVADGVLVVHSSTIVSSSGAGGGEGDGGVGGAVTGSDHSAASLTLQDSIVRGFHFAFTRSASFGSSADLTAEYDDVHIGGSGSGSVPGTVTLDHNIDVDPQFVDSDHDDYHLYAHSPAIDAGGPCDATCASTVDLAGLQPPIDGNGDGTATRDLGAYEYGHRPPTPQLSTVRGIAARASAPFDGSASSDPDDGDQLTYLWTFDDGGAASGPIVTHAFNTPGLHRVVLTVTDSSGLSNTGVAYIQITAEPLAPQSPPPLRTPPIVTGLALSPAAFAVGSRATAIAAGTHPSSSHRPSGHGPAGHVPTGTTIHFNLSETATVTIALAKVIDGHIARGHCQPTARHGRPCAIQQPAGTLTRRAVRAGRVAIAFSGRVGRRALDPGDYVATVTASDSVGDWSRPVRAHFTILGG